MNSAACPIQFITRIAWLPTPWNLRNARLAQMRDLSPVIDSIPPVHLSDHAQDGHFKLQATSAMATLHRQAAHRTARRGRAGSPAQSLFSQAYGLRSQYNATHSISHPSSDSSLETPDGAGPIVTTESRRAHLAIFRKDPRISPIRARATRSPRGKLRYARRRHEPDASRSASHRRRSRRQRVHTRYVQRLRPLRSVRTRATSPSGRVLPTRATLQTRRTRGGRGGRSVSS